MDTKGKIFLIPTTLGDTEPLEVLPISIKKHLEKITYFAVENEKTARRFIKRILPNKNQSSLHIDLLNKYTSEAELKEVLYHCMDGHDVGVLSEAGLPAVADPGARLVRWAHQLRIQVMPLSGPSSIFLALMASGMNGQSFAFNGYLPIEKGDRRKALKMYEKRSSELNQTQIFIETPYRNNSLLESMVRSLSPLTTLSVAVDLTLPTQQVFSMPVAEWKKKSIDLHKRPAVFLIYREN